MILPKFPDCLNVLLNVVLKYWCIKTVGFIILEMVVINVFIAQNNSPESLCSAVSKKWYISIVTSKGQGYLEKHTRHSQVYIFAKNRITTFIINSSPPSVANMCEWIESALVQIMARRLFGAKLLSKPMLGHCRLDPPEQTSLQF